jgi:hypothetical protein
VHSHDIWVIEVGEELGVRFGDVTSDGFIVGIDPIELLVADVGTESADMVGIGSEFCAPPREDKYDCASSCVPCDSPLTERCDFFRRADSFAGKCETTSEFSTDFCGSTKGMDTREDDIKVDGNIFKDVCDL